MSSYLQASTQARSTLQKLRPPCGRSVALRFPYTHDQQVSPGVTVVFPAGEKAVAAGSGTVVSVKSLFAFWSFSAGSMHSVTASYQVVVDHGNDVRTVVHGLADVEVYTGQSVSRGEPLGTPLTEEVFFGVLYQLSAIDPQSVNRHFITQNGNIVVGQGGFIRHAPDFAIRDLSNGIVSTLVKGVRYFVSATCSKPEFLINIDFNGNGQKTGLAATGVASSDYWNVYTPITFTETIVYMACFGSEFNVNPVVPLLDYEGKPSTVRMERVSPLTNDAGSAVRFDTMLSTWIGGEPGGTPAENSFKIRGLPPGTYGVYLYAGQSGVTTDFYISKNGGAPDNYSLTPSAATAFALDDNYIAPQFVLSARDVLTIKGVGYWSGLQLKRT